MMLCAFDSILNMLKPIQKRESGITADVLISLIDQMKNETPLTRPYSKLKQMHTTPMVVLLSKREQKRVQGGRLFTLNTN